jgi:Epoxide hydrolase N terminus
MLRQAARDHPGTRAPWETEYDRRKVAARLNALPRFMTEIDGMDFHFIHVRSKHEHALSSGAHWDEVNNGPGIERRVMPIA